MPERGDLAPRNAPQVGSLQVKAIPVPQVPPWDPVPLPPMLPQNKYLNLYFWGQHNSFGGHGYSRSVEHFVTNQFNRFRVPVPRQDLIIWCWDTVSYHIINQDPDALFFGQSDVLKVQDNAYFQYAILNGMGQFCEVPSHALEVYRYNCNYHHRYQEIYHNPGLDFCFKGLKDEVHNLCDYGLDREMLKDSQEDIHLKRQIKKFYRQYGDSTFDVVHLAIWSSLLWIISPENSLWRYQNHLIFNACYDHGECIVHFGNVYPPSEYRRLARAAHSCVRCGIRSSCTRIYNVNRSNNYQYYELGSQWPTLQLTGVTPGAYILCQRCLRDQIKENTQCHRHTCIETGCRHHPNPTLSRTRALY